MVGFCSVNRPEAAFAALASNYEATRIESIRQLIDTLPRSKKERSNDVEPLVHNLVAAMRCRPDLSAADAAGIEFMIFDILNPGERPGLAQAVANDPALLQLNQPKHSACICNWNKPTSSAHRAAVSRYPRQTDIDAS